MMALSAKAKEAIKVALAMTVAYNIGLRLEWMNPVWIATSVAFVSMPTAGQSLSKAALRMGGTLLALVAGLFYLGLFPQDRWLFFAAFTPYLAFVTYKMTGREGQYFWFCAGFVSMMIISAGPGSSEYAFRFAVDRALETLLGIGLWTLVCTFVWPQSSLGVLESTGGKLLESVGGLVGGLRAALGGADEAGSQALRASAGKLETALRGTIGAAASESYEVREVRHRPPPCPAWTDSWLRSRRASRRRRGCSQAPSRATGARPSRSPSTRRRSEAAITSAEPPSRSPGANSRPSRPRAGTPWRARGRFAATTPAWRSWPLGRPARPLPCRSACLCSTPNVSGERSWSSPRCGSLR
jgi:uncharacterized membrane protein YccC